MKTTAILLTVMLAVAGSAFAQTAPPDTSVTAAAEGSYPAGTLYNGVPLQGFTIANGAIIAGDGSAADGAIGISLMAVPTPLGQQVINIDAKVTGGSSAGAIATVSGTCTVNMGNGTAPITGVPFVATISANADGTGTVGLVLSGVALPTAATSDGTLNVAAMQ